MFWVGAHYFINSDVALRNSHSTQMKNLPFSLWDADILTKKGVWERGGMAARDINSSSKGLGWQVQLASNWERHAVLFKEGSIHTLTHCGDKLDWLQLIGKAWKLDIVQKRLERQFKNQSKEQDVTRKLSWVSIGFVWRIRGLSLAVLNLL